MPTTDVKGRRYARLNELEVGDIVIVDDGFSCIGKWQEREVQLDDQSDLWIKCKSGRHYLSGQLDGKTDALIGIYRKREFSS